MNTRKHKNKFNVTKKSRPNQRELKLYCQEHANSFNQFEKEYEKNFKNDSEDTEKQLIKMFKTPFTPTKYKPQDDYYTYINYQWISDKTQELKTKLKYYVQIDSFRVTQEKVYYELMDITKEYIKNNNSRKSKAIKSIYESMYNLDNTSAENFIKYYVELTDRRIARDDIYEILGGINKNEIISWGSPIVWSVLKDEKNVKYYRSTISTPQLTLYDYQIYIEDSADDQDTKKYKKEFKQRYLEFIDSMFDLCLGKDNGLKASDVWDCEYDLLSALGCDTIKTDDPDGYNIVSKQEALSKYNFNWEKLAKKIGYKNVSNTFICTSTNYLKCVMELLTTDDAWKTPKWRTYYLYICFRQVIRYHSKWRLVYFDFFGKFVKGQPVPYPQEIYPVFGL
jgi:hypothetical protein